MTQKNFFLFLLSVFFLFFTAYSSFADCPVASGDWDYCSLCGPCQSGEGDCDSDTDCAPGLTCEKDAGPQYGYAKGVDVCVGTANPPAANPPAANPPATNPPATNPPATGSNCDDPLYALFHQDECYVAGDGDDDDGGGTGSGCGVEWVEGDWNYCRNCGPCEKGQGGCLKSSECAGALVCIDTVCQQQP